MSEEQLREALLRLGEPGDGPVGARQMILQRVKSRRRRHRVGIGVGALGAAAAIAVGVVWVQPVSRVGHSVKPASTAPYAAPACPGRLPLPSRGTTRLPALSRVTSVRLCTDPSPSGLSGSVTVAERVAQPDPEALVTGFSSFTVALNALPSADPSGCAREVPSRTSLVFTLKGGSSVAVPAIACAMLIRGSTKVDGAAVRRVFLEALDRQRDELNYTREIQTPLTCRVLGASGPARPGRERLVDAIVCGRSPDPNPRRLDGDQLTRLQEAWSRAAAPAPGSGSRSDEGSAEGNPCVDLEDEPRSVTARTDRGDVVRLFQSPCGYLVYDTLTPGRWLQVPLNLADLG